MQNPAHPPVAQIGRMPDARQRNLGVHPFDGKQLNVGLGSGFVSWSKRFVRQVQFAERACGLKW